MKKAKDAQTMGTSYRGLINCSYNSLVETFGQPHSGWSADDKVTAAWGFIIPNTDSPVTIYDYKEYDTPTEEVCHWHIGGKRWNDDYEGIEYVTNLLLDNGKKVKVLA